VTLLRILIAGALLAGLGLTAAAQDQSLGDVARKNRKSGEKKVLTNEDMPKGGGGISTVGAEPAASESSESEGEEAAAETEAAAPAGDAAAAAAPANDTEVQTMEERLKKLEYDEAGLTRRIEKMEAELEEAETDFRREMYQTGLENARNNLDNIRSQKAQTEKALADAKKSKAPGAEGAPAPQQPAQENQPE
jgi:hypothetical protein